MTPLTNYLHQHQGDKGWVLIAQLWDVDRQHLIAPQWLSDSRECEWIDWGTQRFEVTKEELLRLIKPRFNIAHISEEWDRPFRQIDDAQSRMLAALTDHGTYAVDWEEGV